MKSKEITRLPKKFRFKIASSGDIYTVENLGDGKLRLFWEKKDGHGFGGSHDLLQYNDTLRFINDGSWSIIEVIEQSEKDQIHQKCQKVTMFSDKIYYLVEVDDQTVLMKKTKEGQLVVKAQFSNKAAVLLVEEGFFKVVK